MNPPAFTLKVLGDPVLLGPRGPVTGRAAYKRRMALLAILAVARRRPVGRERVIALLWPEHAADAARHTLSESLYVLRRELGDDLFVSVGDEIGLSPDAIGSDVGAFEEALEAGRPEEAVAAYGGPLLDGFYVADAPEFERWVDGERDRLARAFGAALERLAAGAEAQGRALEAVEWWRRLAAHDSYSSRVALRLAQAQEAAGERPAALRTAAAHTARMREELGVEPDAAFAAFVERLRAEPPPAPALRAVTRADAEEAAGPGDEGRETDVGPGGGAAAPSPPAAAPPVAETAVEAEAPAARARPRRARWVAATAVIAVAALLAAMLRPWPPAPRRDAPRYDPQRIAVLYFDDDSPGGELGYLASGLTGELIDRLSQVPALDVVSRNAVKAYRDPPVPFDTLAAALRAGTLVEGSVQRSGDSVRVTVRLVDANRQTHLESRTIVRPLGDLFALEDAVGEEISGFLRRRLGQEVRLRQAQGEARSAPALGLVLRADQLRDDAARLARRRHELDEMSAARLLWRADSLLAGAEAADPGWARPTVMRGFVALRLAGLSPQAERPRLLGAAAGQAGRVLAREPRNAAALELRGRARWQLALVGRGDPARQPARLDEAERDLRAAVDADSTLAPAWAALSQLLRVRGRFAESELLARRALAQDAYLEDADEILLRLYFGAMAQGDYAQARRWCEQGHGQFATEWRFVQCRLTLLREDPSLAPDPARAWALVAELDRLDPPARAREEGRVYQPLYRRAAVAAVLARAGARDSARAVLARTRLQAGSDAALRVPLLWDEAYVAVLLGDRAGARRLLDAYLAAQPAMRPYVARDVAFRDLYPPAAPPPAAPR